MALKDWKKSGSQLKWISINNSNLVQMGKSKISGIWEVWANRFGNWSLIANKKTKSLALSSARSYMRSHK